MHVIFALQPGGMEFGVVKLVNGLDRSRVRSSICSTKPVGEMKALVCPEVPLFELHRRDGNDLRLVWNLYKLFRDERPHVVHTHAWGTLLEGLLAARMARVPIVVHGEHGTLQLKKYQRWLQRAGWSWADQVLSVSSRLAERMVSEMRYPHDRVRTLRNGVDLSRFRTGQRLAAREWLRLTGNELVIGTVGRLVPVKDQATLLDAVAILRNRGVRVTTVIAGDGPLRERLREKAVSLGIAADVRLLGHRSDVDRVLAALDVFVLSSVSEGLSNTILEAMATGVPVVATRVGGADELVVDGVTGTLISAGSPDGLATALEELLLDGVQREAMGTAARRRAESEFSLPTVLVKYQQLYLDLAQKRIGGKSEIKRNGRTPVGTRVP